MAKRGLVVSAVLLTVLVAGACNDPDKPQVLPTLTSSPTPTATSVIPAGAKTRTAQGADAFVRYFFAEMNVAFRESDPSRIALLSNEECVTCKKYMEGLRARSAKGEYLHQDTFVVSGVAAAPLEAGGTVVDVLGTIPKRIVVDAQGGRVRELQADGPFHFQVAIKRTGERWVVSGIRLAVQR